MGVGTRTSWCDLEWPLRDITFPENEMILSTCISLSGSDPDTYNHLQPSRCRQGSTCNTMAVCRKCQHKMQKVYTQGY